MGIFDDATRTDDSPRRHSESSSDFHNRIKGDFWDDVRELLERWFSRVSSDSQADLRSRLRSSEDYNSLGAFLELYLHEALICSGYRVALHPQVPEGPRKPDLLAVGEAQSFYLEARDTTGVGRMSGKGNRVSTLYDAMDARPDPNFLLSVTLDRVGPASLGAKKVFKVLDDWLPKLDPDVISEAMRRDPMCSLPESRFDGEGWAIRLRAIPKSAEARGTNPQNKLLGMFGEPNVNFTDDVMPVRQALSDKGKAYGELDHPYVIAFATSSASNNDNDVCSALYGSEQVNLEFIDGGDPIITRSRATNGYWYAGSGWIHRSVSGVLLIRDLYPAAVSERVPELWLHPDPLRPVERLLSWNCLSSVEGMLIRSPNAVEPRALFDLPTPWPRGAPFPHDGW